MKFVDLSWAAVCYYYRSSGDRKYCKIISDEEFINAVRENPQKVDCREFENKVILDYISITNYDLLYKSKLSRNILTKLSELNETLKCYQGKSIIDCDFSDSNVIKDIRTIYENLLSTEGLWSTGTSKILHILNSKLFAPMSPSIEDHFREYTKHSEYISWLIFVQRNVFDVINDFKDNYSTGKPEDYLSTKMNYCNYKCNKSLVKYIDEYYWLTLDDKLPVPPIWIPEYTNKKIQYTSN